MRRTFKLLALLVVVLVVSVVVLVEWRAEDQLPPPDPAMPIHVSEGFVLSLAEVVEQAQAGTLPVRTDDDGPKVWTPPSPEALAAQAAVHEANAKRVRAWEDNRPPLYRLGETALDEGRLDEALALFASIPEEDPYWADAQRCIGWDILAKRKGQPRRAVSYVQAAAMADPLEGNAWQDLARVYAGTLGFEID